MTKKATTSFKGNKAALPSKICVTCGREMTWRKSWAKNWAEVKYCSDACRTRKIVPSATTHLNASKNRS